MMIDTRARQICPGNNGGGYTAEHGSRLNNGSTYNRNSGIPLIGPAFVRGETMGGVFAIPRRCYIERREATMAPFLRCVAFFAL